MRKLLLYGALCALSWSQNMRGQDFTENFDNIATLAPSGWVLQNVSTPLGITTWLQGVNVAGGGPFDAYNGAPNAYISANFNNTGGGTGIISNWMLTPNRTFRNGDVLTFYTRKAAPDTYPDRMEVRMSTNGASTNLGNGSTVGDFTTMLMSINPTLVTGVYPTTWTMYTITISGLPAPTSGRIGFRYFVTGAGPAGNNSDYIGVDNVVYTSYICPPFTITPASGALAAANGGMPYSASLSQTGARGVANYTLTAGALPPGLTLSATGTITGTPTAIGTFNFTVTVNDNSGCSGSNAYSITVAECSLVPPASLPDITSQCSVALSEVTAIPVTDGCGNTITPVTDPLIFPITAQGTTTITWTYTGLLGNVQTLTQNIVIADTTSPIPTTATLENITAQCEVTLAEITAPTATDNCLGAVTVTHDATFPISAQGTTTITWTYTDASGNTATQTQDVVIADTTSPIPTTATLENITAQCEVTLAEVTAPMATDNCLGTVTVTHDATFPITAQGTTTITWTYTDASGNTATQTQDVVIADTASPIPTTATLENITAQCEVTLAEVTAPTATDNCLGTVTVTHDATFPITAQGTTTITWTYTDASGNTATQTQDVVIADTTSPVVAVTNLVVSIDASAQAVITASQLDNGSTDNCGIALVTVSPDTFSCDELGDHEVTVTVTDFAGNTASATATVTVNDNDSNCPLAVSRFASHAFEVYPNPSADVVNIVPAQQQTLQTVTLYSISGQQVLKNVFNNALTTYTVSIGQLPQGIYLMKLESASGTTIKRIARK